MFLFKNNKEEMKSINSKLKTILLFCILYLLFPLSVNAAGWADGGTTEDNVEKPIVEDNKVSGQWRLDEYCSFYSDKTFDSEYGEADENAVIQNGLPYAPLIDTINGTGRNNTSVGSENVLEYQGEYYSNYK